MFTEDLINYITVSNVALLETSTNNESRQADAMVLPMKPAPPAMRTFKFEELLTMRTTLTLSGKRVALKFSNWPTAFAEILCLMSKYQR